MTGKNENKNKSRETRKTRLWFLDPSVFQSFPRASFLRRHIVGRVRSLGKYGLYSLGFAYPVLLVSLGIIFGGLAFWGALAGSVGLIWLAMKRAGYSRNFAEWWVGNKRFLGLFGAFVIVLAFFYGLIQLREWIFPIVGGVLVITLMLGVRRFSGR